MPAITLLDSKPLKTFAIKPFYDSTCTFYFDKAEWNKSIDKITTQPNVKEQYLGLLDSIQLANKVISFSALQYSPAEKWQLNPGVTTTAIFDSLLQIGHVFIQLNDNSPLKVLLPYIEKDAIGEGIVYTAKSNSLYIYFIGKPNPGEGFH